MAKTKKLTASNILSLHSKTFTQKVVHINIEGQDFEVLVDTKFKVTKIQELIVELMEHNQDLIKVQDTFEIPYYASFLMLKYFTNIQIAQETDFEKQIRLLTALMNLGVFDKVMDSFDEKEIEKFNMYMRKATKRISEIKDNKEVIDDINAMVEDIISLENPEVFIDEGEEDASI